MTHEAFSTKRVTVWRDNKGERFGYSIQYQDGYISWCPEDVYFRDYQPVDALSFGHAIYALKQGERVARAGWNDKGMWLYRVNGNSNFSDVTFEHLPFFAMKTADNKCVPWLASQTDMLADDWQIVQKPAQ